MRKCAISSFGHYCIQCECTLIELKECKTLEMGLDIKVIFQNEIFRLSRKHKIFTQNTLISNMHIAHSFIVLPVMPDKTQTNEEIFLALSKTKRDIFGWAALKAEHLLVRKFSSIHLMGTPAKVSLAPRVCFLFWISVLFFFWQFSTVWCVILNLLGYSSAEWGGRPMWVMRGAEGGVTLICFGKDT